MATPLYRNSNSSWSYFPKIARPDAPKIDIEEIQLELPEELPSQTKYNIIQAITRTFQEMGDSLTFASLQKPIPVMQWKMVATSVHKTLLQRIVQYIPFTSMIEPPRLVSLKMQKNKNSSLPTIDPPIPPEPILLPTHVTTESFIQRPSFSDPFTALAATSAQTTEQFFVMEKEPKSSFQFVLQDNTLSLRESSSEEENRIVLTAFIEHLQREYGVDLLDFLKVTYDIDLEQMREKSLPLLPDHVLKANIAASNIEMSQLTTLYINLKRLAVRLKKETVPLDSPFTSFLTLDRCGIKNYLCIRELRNLLQLIPNATCREALRYIEETFPPHQSPMDLPAQSFNRLVGLIAPKNEEIERICTGRAIHHLPIFGFNTMGDKKIQNRSREMFELLQIFPLLKDSTWQSYYELLGHVVSKKTLYRPNRDMEGFHTGLLIPGPTNAQHEEIWYVNDTFLDDSNGNFSYTLRPACNNYRMRQETGAPLPKLPPYIKLYRSTASDDSNPNGKDSVAADCNWTGPGSLKPELSYYYEKDLFQERTLPIWMGYVLLGRLYKDTPTANYTTWLHHAVANFEKYREVNKLENKIPKGDITKLYHMLLEEQYQDVLDELIRQARVLHELPQEKIGQDLAFVGHSLGGALAQAGVIEFVTTPKRIPLPGCSLICATSHPPGIANQKNAKFMSQGDKHEEMLRLNDIHFQVTHQFEKGDFVPQSGGSHLGSVSYMNSIYPCGCSVRGNPDTKHRWLNFSSYVFSPLRSAKTKEIVAAPTHGRRIGHSVENRDFTITPLSQQELQEYDHAQCLCKGRVAKAFDYKILSCPKYTETLRKACGAGYRAIHACRKRIRKDDEGKRNRDDVLYLTLRG